MLVDHSQFIHTASIRGPIQDRMVSMVRSRLGSTDVYGLGYNVLADLTGQISDLDHGAYPEFFDSMRANIGVWVYKVLGGRTDFTYTYQALWGVEYGSGAWARPHRHGATCLSFTYYPLAPEGSSPLVFDDWDYSVPVSSGTLILFPGWASHSVPEYQPRVPGDTRVVVAGNILIY